MKSYLGSPSILSPRAAAKGLFPRATATPVRRTYWSGTELTPAQAPRGEPDDERRGAIRVPGVDQVRAAAVVGRAADPLEPVDLHDRPPAAVPGLNRLIHSLVLWIRSGAVGVGVGHIVLPRGRLESETQGEVSSLMHVRIEHPVPAGQGHVSDPLAVLLAARSGGGDRERNRPGGAHQRQRQSQTETGRHRVAAGQIEGVLLVDDVVPVLLPLHLLGRAAVRSEERRVGKECRSRWSPY